MVDAVRGYLNEKGVKPRASISRSSRLRRAASERAGASAALRGQERHRHRRGAGHRQGGRRLRRSRRRPYAARRSLAAVEEVARAIVEEGGVALPMTADLETWSGNVQVMEKAQRSHGAIDVLVNNVGGRHLDAALPAFRRAADRGRDLTLALPRAVGLPRRAADHAGAGQGDDRQCLVDRDQGHQPRAYSAAKGAVNALTASLAFEVGTRNIRVNAVAPGGTTAPPRKVPRGTDQPTEQDKALDAGGRRPDCRFEHMHRYGLLREMAAAILFSPPTPPPTSPAPCCPWAAATRAENLQGPSPCAPS